MLPGLNIDLDVHGLASHDAGDSDEYGEWGVSGGFRYDPRPETAAGPLVSLVHSWNPAGGGGLREALWRNDPAAARTAVPRAPGGYPERGIRAGVQHLRRGLRALGAGRRSGANTSWAGSSACAAASRWRCG